MYLVVSRAKVRSTARPHASDLVQKTCRPRDLCCDRGESMNRKWSPQSLTLVFLRSSTETLQSTTAKRLTRLECGFTASAGGQLSRRNAPAGFCRLLNRGHDPMDHDGVVKSRRCARAIAKIICETGVAARHVADHWIFRQLR